jgi:hypothetical protein
MKKPQQLNIFAAGQDLPLFSGIAAPAPVEPAPGPQLDHLTPEERYNVEHGITQGLMVIAAPADLYQLAYRLTRERCIDPGTSCLVRWPDWLSWDDLNAAVNLGIFRRVNGGSATFGHVDYYLNRKETTK